MTTLEKAEREIREGGPGLTKEERQAIAQELDRLRAANMGMDAEIAESERQLEQAQRENSKLRAEVAEARDSLQSCKRNHELSMRAADSAEGRLKGEIASWKNCAREWEAQDKIVRAREDRKDQLIEELRAELAKAKADYQFMVDRACDEHLDGYRELASKVCAAEDQRDESRAEVADLKAEVEACLKMAERNAEQRDAALSEVAALKGEAERVVYVAAVEHDGGAKSAIWRLDTGYHWPTADGANVYGQGAWEVRVSARKVQP